MGSRVKYSAAIIESIAKSNLATIICGLSKRHMNRIYDIFDETISLNIMLAQIIVKFNIDDRLEMVHQEAISILTKSTAPIILKDFEMLFDPRYNIDVLRLITEVSRKRKIIAIWPGVLDKDNLVYADAESPDYQVFNINNYDIICVY